MAPPWKIRCYTNDSGRNEIEKWYANQSATAQAAFDSALEFLVHQPREAWVRPEATRLAGAVCRGLYEIRIKAERKQIRPLGFFGPDEANEFTIVFVALEKGNEFEPSNACKTANARKSAVLRDKSKHSCECYCSVVNVLCTACTSPCCQSN